MNVKPVIAIDLDEVLAHFIPKLADFHNEIYGTSLTMDHFHSYEFHKVWGGSLEETSHKVISFFQSTYIHELSTVSGSYDALKLLKDNFSLQIVTARQNKFEELTKQWINKNFPNIFDDIHFGNHYSSNGKSVSKPEMCKNINAILLIDDSLIYAKHCANYGIPVILFGNYPWNKIDKSGLSNAELHLINPVNNWNEVIEKVNEIANSSNDKKQQIQLSNQIRVAAIQMCSINNKEKNIQTIERLISRAVAEGGAKFICLPECCIYMSEKSIELLDIAEEINPNINDSSIQKLCELAKKYHVYLSVGGFPEKRIDLSNKVSNTHIIINDFGEIVFPTYRKIHLFDNPLTGLQESKITAPGNEIVTIDTSFGKLGLSICYDIRFPELYNKLCNPSIGGSEIVLVPSAFTVPTGKAHWELLLRTRAIENQVYIIAAAQSGQHNENRVSYGHTMIVDPWGNIIDEIKHDGEGICYATLSRENLQKVRSNMPVWTHRRSDLY